MSTYLSFKNPKTKETIFWISRNNPIVEAFIESFSGGIPYDEEFELTEQNIDAAISYVNKEILDQRTLFLLKLIQKDSDEYALKNLLEEYDGLLETRGQLITIQGIFDHLNGLSCYYG